MPKNLDKSQITKNKEYKKKMIIKYFTIVFSFLSIYILLSPLVFGFIISEEYNTPKIIQEEKENKPHKDNSIPKKTKFLLVGMDQSDLLADVIILGVFDKDTKNINLINIPRDTFVSLSKETRDFIFDNGRKVPKTTKMSNLYSHSGKKLGMEVFQRHLKDEFNVDVDYHLIMYIDSFKKIVDILGPITMEIPKGGLYYTDPVQKLKIKVPEGVQKLDGKLAEGVVRYRATYKRGDLQRIEMQQKFIMELFKQTLSKENLLHNIVPLATTIIKNIETNFKIEELYKYLPYIIKLKEDNLIMQTLPGAPEMLKDDYSNLNISYLVCDKKESKKIIEDLFFEKNIEDDTEINLENDNNLYEELEYEYNKDIKDYSIKILNGSNKNNIEKIKKKELQKEGFEDVSSDIYKGYKTANTRIITKSPINKELKKYFPTAVFIVDERYFKEENKDIIVIIGTLEG